MGTILYLGLELPPNAEKHVIHCPLIEIIPRPPQSPDIEAAFQKMDSFTHFIFTSKSAVKIFSEYLSFFHQSVKELEGKEIIAVGKATAQHLTNRGREPTLISPIETAEGIIMELKKFRLDHAHILWPHGALSRRVLSDFFVENQIKFTSCILYDTVFLKPNPLPILDKVAEIVFTSPSTVDAFVSLFGSIPMDKTLTCIGPVTQAHLDKLIFKEVPLYV